MTSAVAEPEQAPDLQHYLPEPNYTEDQEADVGLLLFARGFVLPTAPRTYAEALDWLAGQSTHPDRDYEGLCQLCMRMADGCPGGAPSALSCFQNMPSEFRTVGGDPKDAPIGADLFSRARNAGTSSFKFGHVLKKARPFTDGSMGGWSTDALRVGRVDKINPPALYDRWGHDYLGWGYMINGMIIDVKDPKPPVPRKPYNDLGDALVHLEQAADEMRAARTKAVDLKDSDAQDIQNLIDRALDLKGRTRNKFDNLRHR